MKLRLLTALLSLTLASTAFADPVKDIADLFLKKNYRAILKKYEENKAEVLGNPTAAYQASLAYERLKLYDSAIKVNLDVIEKNYSSADIEITKAIEQKTSVSSEQVPKNLKAAYVRIFGEYADKILNTDSKSALKDDDVSALQTYKKTLDKLEYSESYSDKVNDKISAHLKLLDDRVYHWSVHAFLDFQSWQTKATLNGPYEQTSLLSTNEGFCPGVGVTYENNFWAFGSDLSFLYGSGGVSVTQGTVKYQQADVPAYGFKLSAGAGMIVSSTRSELGLRLTYLNVKQSLESPTSAGYSVTQENTASEVISLYSRWNFNSFYLQTDFGRYYKRPATLWSIGMGYIF